MASHPSSSPAPSSHLSLPPCVFSCRIVVIDSYLAAPLKNLDVCFSDFRSAAIEKVPVIRIFGATPAGQKSCVHVHGAFPYLLVPCLVLEPTDAYLQQLARSIDHALQVSLGASSRTAIHVFKIVVVKGIPFYGYHDTEELFLRIYLINPGLIKRLAELLLAGAVMNQVLQPHESHIPFPLQFLMDYNLFGMNHIHLSAVKFRVASDEKEGHTSKVKTSPSHRRRRSLTSPFLSPLSSPPCTPSLLYHPSQNVWDVNALPSDMVLCEPRRSVTELEVDVLAADILNRHELSLVSDGYPGLAAIWEEERLRRQALNIEDPLSPPPSPERGTQPYHTEECRLREMFAEVLEERLGMSNADSAISKEEEVVQSSPSDDVIFSQSCDLDLHQPVVSEGDVVSESVARDDREVLVDEKAVKESMELSQRLSREAIEKSTDVEILELMAELCQTPPLAASLSQLDDTQSQFHPLSQSQSMFQQSSQSVGERLTGKIKRSRSIISAKSLFSCDSQDEDSEHSEEEERGDELEAAEKDSESRETDFIDQMELDSGDDLFIAMETELDDRRFSSPVVKISSEPEPKRALQQAKTARNLPFRSPKSALRHRTADTDEESEVDVPISTPLASPIPPSPKSKELQSTILEEIDSFVSSGEARELDDLDIGDSQFDISLSQIQTPSSQCSRYSKTHPELDSVWNATASECPGDSQSPFQKLVAAGEAAKPSGQNVQLEYDMPEITASQLETSSDHLFNPLETDSPKSSLVKSQASVARGHPGSLVKASLSLSHSARRQLLHKPTADSIEESSNKKPRSSRRTRSKSRDIPQLDGVNDDPPSLSGQKPSRKRRRVLGMQRTRKKQKKNDAIPIAMSDSHQQASSSEQNMTTSGAKVGGGDSAEGQGVSLEQQEERAVEDSVEDVFCVVEITSSEDNVKAAGDEAVSEEEPFVNVQDRGDRDGVAESKTRDASSDESQSHKDKARLSLSLNKSATRTCRTRESEQEVAKPTTKPEMWRSSTVLTSRALRGAMVLKVDKLSHLSWSGRAAGKHSEVGPTERGKSDPQTRKRSVSRSASESEDNLSTGRERRERYSRRCHSRDTRQQYSPTYLTYQQQLKRAMELSKQSYLAESANSGSSVEEKEVENECKETEQISSPPMFSPPSSDELNRTIVEESPPKGEEGWTFDLSISSISESPPFSSSPQEMDEEVLHDSTLKLQLETSFTDMDRPPLESSSPSTSRKLSVTEANEFLSDVAVLPVSRRPADQPNINENTVIDLTGECTTPPPPQRVATSPRAAAVCEEDDVALFDHTSFPLPLPASPESVENQSEMEQLLSQSTDIEEEGGFHLAYSSSSEEELPFSPLGKEGSLDSECLDFSTVKTAETVTFAPRCSSPKQSLLNEGQSSPDEPVDREIPVTAVMKDAVDKRGWVCLALAPPTLSELTESASFYSLPTVCHQQPFYSCPTDVQRPMMIGQRSLRVPSKMPYDLKPFHVVYSRDGENVNSQFSSTGLRHMRMVLSVLGTGTQPAPLPPDCHPQQTGNGKTNQYTFDDYKRDIELRASFFKPEKVVITPALPPPHPSKFAALLLKGKAGGRETDSEGDKREKMDNGERKMTDEEGGDASVLESAIGSPSSSLPAATQEDQDMDHATAPSSMEDESHLKKSPSLCRSDASLDGSTHDSSLTSYQVPRYHEHSTPLMRGVADDGHKGVESMERTKKKEERLSLTPVRQKKDDTSKPRPLLPFTPIPPHPQRDHSHLEGPTPNNPCGFKVSQSALPGSCDNHDVQFLTCLSAELHVRTRTSLRPDPEFDPILAIFYFIHNDWPLSPSSSSDNGGREPGENSQLGIIAIDVDNCGFRQSGNPSPKKAEVDKDVKSPAKGSAHVTKTTPSPITSPTSSLSSSPRMRQYLDGCGLVTDVEVMYVSSELELIEKVVELVRQVDPDFLIGYEIAMVSWGYLIERAAKLNVNLNSELSRMPNFGQSDRGIQGNDSNWKTLLNITGRIMFSVWRLLKYEVALTGYTFENVAYHILHQRVPNYSFKTLSLWYDHPTSLYRHRVVEHYLIRCQGNHQLLESFNLIGRTSEFSRLYGIEFESVVNRGSQYRVESMMLRLAKPANFVPVSPSVQQRARMAAPECIPLVLEPESKFYADPILVLDFQSLYPSMVIAYNYCFSTCLGRVHHLASHGNFPFGATSLNVPNTVLKKLKDKVHISPNGIVFVKDNVRRGILPRMLEDILGTRIMVKNSMKKHKQNKALERMLNARQLGLKLIANTTYGYTGASFSGRMPCIEVADSIVRKGRETLERAIQMVNSSAEWQAKVVYGDTDSLFVLLKGASKEEAFRIGKEISERVTADNPKPVKLKFEKVYLPCILQTKKRYVGFMYETLEQKEPEFDAKGIETVRRDSCPAVAKMLEKSLRLLYSTRDVSLVKSYVQRQFKKVLEGRVDLKDYTFAKEYRGKAYYRPGAAVPALEITKHYLVTDRRSEPRIGERVPYVVVYGTPGQPLIQLVKRPEDLLDNPALRLNGIYYITKQLVPTLDRCFSLLGVDVRQWYSEIPQVRRAPAQVGEGGRRVRGTIGQYFATMHCPVCEQLTVEGVCSQCRRDPAKVATTLSVRMRDAERSCSDIEKICQNCTGSLDLELVSACISLDCPVNYRRYKASQEKASVLSLRTLLSNSLPPQANIYSSD